MDPSASGKRKALSASLSFLLLTSCTTGTKKISRMQPVRTPQAVTAEKKGAEDAPLEAMEFYLLMRTGGDPLPAEKLLAAKRHKDTMRPYSLALRRFVTEPLTAGDFAASLGTWKALGPGNIGGRTRSLIIRPDNPDVMYAGAVGGGVWKTTDGGKSWNPQSDFLPSIGISTLAIDPNNLDTLYAGTGESFAGDGLRGAGIFKTTDGGAHWTQLPGTTTPDFYYVNKVVVSPKNSRNVYAATYEGVYGSTDGGTTWKVLLDQSEETQPGCQDLVIRTDQPTDYLFASCALHGYDNPAIWRNTDVTGRGRWEAVLTADNMARTSLALAPSNQGIVYAAASSSENGNYEDGLLAVYRSTSNGDSGTWTAQVTNQDSTLLNTLLFTNPREATEDVCSGGTASFFGQGDWDNVIAVDPVNPNTVWVGGVDLFRSDDGGQTWGIAAFWEASPPQLSHADHHAIAFAPGYDGVGNQTMFDANDGGIYRTDNALAPTAAGSQATCAPYPTSVVWSNINNGYAVTQFYAGAVYPGAAAYMGGTQDNDTPRGSDASGPMRWAVALSTGDGTSVAIDPTDPNIFFAWGTSLDLNKTTNGGSSFVSATKGITEKAGNFLWQAGFVMDPTNSKRLYTGGKSLWRTADSGKTWAAASAAVPAAAGSISTIAVSPVDANRVAFGTANGFVFTNKMGPTANKTTAWPSSRPRPGFLRSLAFDPTNVDTIYAVYSQFKTQPSDGHVYKSTDGGVTWKNIDGTGSTGIPDVPVDAIVVDPQATSHLYIGTDIGMFVTTDGGATWSRDSNPFADAPVDALVLDRSAGPSTLVAFTHGRGVWKTELPGSGTACQYTVSTSSIRFLAYGGSQKVNVTAGNGCAWSALSSNPDFGISSPAAGRGSGTFTVTAQYVNLLPQPDLSQIAVQNHGITVTQDAPLRATGNDDAGSPFPLGTLPAVAIQDTTGATPAKGDPVHSCTKSADSKSVWFSFTAPAAGKVAVNFSDLQAGSGTNAGAVITAYPVANGKLGQEIACYVLPQSSSDSQEAYVYWTAAGGATYLVEVAATTSGAPAGSSIMGGNLAIWVSQ